MDYFAGKIRVFILDSYHFILPRMKTLVSAGGLTG
jgi:hypothetical protein